MRAASSAILVVLTISIGAPSLSAQTLGDVARQEAERRKAVPSEGKVYTNKDLKTVPAPPPTAADTASPAPPSSPQGTPAAGTDAASKDVPAAPSGGSTPPTDDAPKGEEYWRGRLKELQTTLARSETYVDALQSRINALATEFVNRDDPAQREGIEADRRKALAELDRLKKDIETNRKAINDLQEEARRARVPPGWLR